MTLTGIPRESNLSGTGLHRVRRRVKEKKISGIHQEIPCLPYRAQYYIRLFPNVQRQESVKACVVLDRRRNGCIRNCVRLAFAALFSENEKVLFVEKEVDFTFLLQQLGGAQSEFRFT